MGRTIPTFNTILEAEYDSWRPYRRALRKEEQEVFDALFRAAKKHVAESSYAVRASPFEAMLFSMLLEQQNALQAIWKKVMGEEGEKTSPPGLVLTHNSGRDKVEG